MNLEQQNPTKTLKHTMLTRSTGYTGKGVVGVIDIINKHEALDGTSGTTITQEQDTEEKQANTTTVQCCR